MDFKRITAVAFAGGIAGALLILPSTASAMPVDLNDCYVPAQSDAARGGYGDQDTRRISLREQRAIEAKTARILAYQARESARLNVAAKGKPGSGGGGTDPAGAAYGNVPVYVHEMLGSNGEGNVTPGQVQAQIDILNATYGSNDANEPAGAVVADTGARFYLAGNDEYFNNNWHKDRQSSSYRTKTRQGGAKSLNIWLVDFNYLGIATFPWDYTANPGIDGIRVQWNSLPTADAVGYPAIANYDLGETATHEAGHWFGLYHTFQGGCTDTNDEVADTAAQSSSTDGCPEGRDSCNLPGLDPIHNYMDYSYDSCYYEFSGGQTQRMVTMWTAYRP
jgi:hypothetical protein